MDHGTYRELAAGAALDDLDASERSSLDGHLRVCGPCRGDASALADTAGLLALAAPRRVPPASLRGDVMAAIAASGAMASSAPILDLGAIRRERTIYRRLSFAGLAAAAALAIAVGALGASAAGLRGDLDAAARDLDAAAAERDAAVARLAATDGAMSVVLAPDHATATLTPEPMAAGATVYVVFRPGTTEAWLMAGQLPATPAGHVYQLWSADKAGVHPLTMFTCDGSHACLAPFGVDLAVAKATMITLEPAGGAQGEPGPQVAFGNLEG
jgi:hypothetical protein